MISNKRVGKINMRTRPCFVNALFVCPLRKLSPTSRLKEVLKNILKTAFSIFRSFATTRTGRSTDRKPENTCPKTSTRNYALTSYSLSVGWKRDVCPRSNRTTRAKTERSDCTTGSRTWKKRTPSWKLCWLSVSAIDCLYKILFLLFASIRVLLC